MATLRSKYFAPIRRLQVAAEGTKPIAFGEHSESVALVQAALSDLGYRMPKSTRANGSLDGVFGKETLEQLQQYQTAKKLKPDGIAGPRTLGLIDQEMFNRQLPPPATPPEPPKIMPKMPPPPSVPVDIDDLNYKIGTEDPPVTRDIGAGPWNASPFSFVVATQAAGILLAVQTRATVVYPGWNATKHMEHFFTNTGKDYTIDLEDMIKSTDRAKKALLSEARQAFRFIQQLPVGTHRFTSKMAQSSYNYQNETTDWFFAIGGYSYWGKGTAKITETYGQRHYEVDFEYHFFDRYNWDGKKSVTIPIGEKKIKITDEFMQEFHKTGIAREFDCYGMVKRKFSWRGTRDFPSEQQILTPGR